MGKGDKKSRRGKIAIGSYGVRRRSKIKRAVPAAKVKPAPPKKPVKKSPEVPAPVEEEAGTTVAAATEAKPAKKKAAPKTTKKDKPATDKDTGDGGE